MNLSFNFTDFLIVLVILVSAGYACWRGFLSETLTIFAWAAAAFATLYFGPWVVPLTRSLISTPWLGSLAAYAGVFLVVFIPLSFMSHRFSESVKHSPIGPLDRALGIAFGVVRGLVVVAFGYLVLTYFTPIRQQPRWITEARLLPLMQSSSEVLLSLVPSRDHADFTGKPSTKDAIGDFMRGGSSDDKLGNFMRNQNEQANKEPVKKDGKTYGAKDRSALDSLLKGKP